jgi:hypothetical protein
MCFRVEVSATVWSLVQSSPTELGVSECGREASIMRTPWPTGGCCAMGGVYSLRDAIMFSVSYYCLKCHGLVLDHTFLSLTSHSTLVQCRTDTSWINSSENCALFFFLPRSHLIQCIGSPSGSDRWWHVWNTLELPACSLAWLELSGFFHRSFTKPLPFSPHPFFITVLASLSTSTHTKWFL